MTDFATLNIKVDSSDADDASRDLDRLTASGKQAESAVDSLGATSTKAGAQIKSVGKSASEYAAAAQTAARNATGMGEATGLARHHVMSLGYQFQDLAVQMSTAAQSSSPLKMGLMALMQQGGQIGQIMGQAGVSVGQLATFMARATGNFLKAHPILVGLGVASGAAAGAFKLFSAEIDKSGQLKTYADSLGLTKKEMEELGPVSVTAGDAIKGIWKTISDGLGLENVFSSIKGWAVDAFEWLLHAGKVAAAGVYAAFVGTFKGIAAVWPMLPSVIGDAVTGAANAAIGASEWILNKTIKVINVLSSALNQTIGQVLGLSSIPTISEVHLGRISNSYAGAGKRAGEAFVGAYKTAYGDAMSGMDALGTTLTDNILNASKDRLKSKADDIIDDRTAKSAGSKAGKAAGESFIDKFMKEANARFDKAWNGFLEEWVNARKGDAAEIASQIFDIEEEMRTKQRERTQGVIDEAEARARVNDELRQTIDYLDRIGGVGKTLGDIGAVIYGLRTGDFTGTSGPVAALLEFLKKSFPDFVDRMVKGLDDVLTGIFGPNGTFTNLLQGAGAGTAVSQVLYGGKDTGAQIGGAVGGAVGYALGGPLGTIIGSTVLSTVGHLVGKIFGSAKYGSASVSASGVSTGGNNDNSRGAASGAGGAVSSAISQIAAALGGSIGNYSVSIGETDGKWRISTTGRSGELKSKYSDVQVFGKGDAAYQAAVRAAILDAIKDGAITGVSAAVQRLLQGGSDIDAQLKKAQLFQGVFAELKASADPLGAALDGVTKQFDELRSIFAEAGASAEEYASLEQLLTIKRQEAIDNARKAGVDKISDQFNLQIKALELMGRSQDALAATRFLELAGIKESLQPLQQLVYELEDARSVIDTFGPLADSLREYRKELLGGQGATSFGQIAAQFRAVALAAANGDATALGKLQGVSSSYLDAARLNAGSSLDYRRALGQVLSAVDQGIFAADTKVDYAQLQIDAINNSADIMQAMRNEMNALQSQVVSNTAFMANLMKRFDGGEGLLVTTLSDTPLQVEVSA